MFCGTLTTDGLEVTYGKLRIVREGRISKFVQQVEQVSFSGSIARSSGRNVLFVTERAAFRLQKEGLELIDVASNMQRDVVDRMEFVPIDTAGEMRHSRVKWMSSVLLKSALSFRQVRKRESLNVTYRSQQNDDDRCE